MNATRYSKNNIRYHLFPTVIFLLISVLIFAGCSQAPREVRPTATLVGEFTLSGPVKTEVPGPQVEFPETGLSAPTVEDLNYYAFNYQEYDASEHNDLGGNFDGWKIGKGQIFYVNETGQPLPPGILVIVSAEVETAEGVNYPAAFGYPATERALTPRIHSEFALSTAKGNGMGQPVTFQIGEKLPVPPSFPIRITGMSYFGFRFAQTAHPTFLKLTTKNNKIISIDLTKSFTQVPAPENYGVNSLPLTEFASMTSFSNDEYNFYYAGNCVLRDNVAQIEVELPYVVENKNQFNGLDERFVHDLILYTPGGFAVEWDDKSLLLKAGPGQVFEGKDGIGLFFTFEDLGAPTYLIHVDNTGNLFPFNLNCSDKQDAFVEPVVEAPLDPATATPNFTTDVIAPTSPPPAQPAFSQPKLSYLGQDGADVAVTGCPNGGLGEPGVIDRHIRLENIPNVAQIAQLDIYYLNDHWQWPCAYPVWELIAQPDLQNSIVDLYFEPSIPEITPDLFEVTIQYTSGEVLRITYSD